MEVILNENEPSFFFCRIFFSFFSFSFLSTRVDDDCGDGDASYGSDGDRYTEVETTELEDQKPPPPVPVLARPNKIHLPKSAVTPSPDEKKSIKTAM